MNTKTIYGRLSNCLIYYVWLWITVCSSLLSYQAQAQQLYGMTQQGGADGIGAIVKFDVATNTLTTPYSMISFTSGSRPKYTDLREYNGKFYGVTQSGGTTNQGVIFEWDPATNIYTKKKDFNGTDGSYPYGSLTLSNGKFYGMTATGGVSNQGVIFEWDPTTNIYTKKKDFNSTEGANPFGNLTLSNGKFYGMTTYGGTSDQGVIFEWDPATNVYTKKKDFTGTEGANPFGNLTPSNGKFYGMTRLGGTNNLGVIFEWDPATNIYTKKKDFNGTEGSEPEGSLTLYNSKFYGVTLGGVSNQGVLFEWDPATNVYTKKKDFNGTDGANPTSSLTLSNGKFYGMTSSGGTSTQGVIFEWDPVTNVYTKKKDFNGTDGSGPSSSLTLSNGKFYGMVLGGGVSNQGVIFEWNPTTNVYTKKKDLNPTDGTSPLGSLTLYNGKFYGMTKFGGTNNRGVIFEWNPTTHVYTKKKDFNSTDTDGFWPEGSLTLYNGKFYGMTYSGGVNVRGVIFEWDPATNVYTKKKDFNSTDGISPHGSLTLYNGKFYGMTQLGGSFDAGVIFEWDPTTNVYARKKSFDGGSDGSSPWGSLTLYNGKFYGMTRSGALGSTHGVIFEWDPAGLYTRKKAFNGTDGRLPHGNNLTLSNGKFYGMTTSGGVNDLGVLFEWDPATNVYTKKKDFNSTDTDGFGPSGSLKLSNGKLYGMTSRGGVNDRGVLFEWDPATNVYTKKADFTGANGASPSFGGQLVELPTQTSCSPRSYLPCSELPVNIPYRLEFNGNVVGTLADRNGNGIGFTMVDPPSARLAIDNPVYLPSVPGYQPDRLELTGGVLQITSSKGIQTKYPTGIGSSANTNSQLNALGVAFQANQNQIITISVDLKNVDFSLSAGNNYQQGGLWFGLDEDHYVKLVLSKTGTNTAAVQLLVEDFDVPSATPSLTKDSPNNAITNPQTQIVKLIMEIDPVNHTAQGFYIIGNGAKTPIVAANNSLNVPASFFEGLDHDNVTTTAKVSFAGIFTTHRNAGGATSLSQSINFRFDNFSINYPSANVAPVVNNAIPNQAATLGQVFNYTVPAGAFSDPNGDNLTLSATLSDGSVLPAWLSFNFTTGTFSGTPNQVGNLTIRVTASDGSLSVSNNFTLTILPRLQFSSGTSNIILFKGQNGSVTTLLNTSNASDPVNVILNALDPSTNQVPTWLQISGQLVNGITLASGNNITFVCNASGLPIGIYTAQITASSAGYLNGTLTITLSIVDQLKVNFSDANTPAPTGYFKDFGEAYGLRLPSMTYGWYETNLSAPLSLVGNGRNRNPNPDVNTINETLIHMQYDDVTNGTNGVRKKGSWQCLLPNGTYQVIVTTGDSDNELETGTRHVINAEGINILDFMATIGSPNIQTTTGTVVVNDGNLTLDAIGGKNTKIISAEITLLNLATLKTDPVLLVDDLETEPLVYPNPVMDELNIQYNNTAFVVSIVNVLGTKVFEANFSNDEKTVHKINVKDLPTGVYLVHVRTGKSAKVCRIIKR
jgi:uncharacterized repeat protein (TIGR03803 family)